jgi:hypothetical protein
MTTLHLPTILSDPPPRDEPGPTRDEDLQSARSAPAKRDWNAVIDNCLIEWGRDTDGSCFRDEEEDFVPPTPHALHLAACRVAPTMRDAGLPAPLHVVPDGNGGLSFEFEPQDRTWFASLDIGGEGSVELLVFDEGRLIFRERQG